MTKWSICQCVKAASWWISKLWNFNPFIVRLLQSAWVSPGYTNDPTRLLGKIFEIDRENPQHRKKLWNWPVKIRDFWEKAPLQNPGDVHDRGSDDRLLNGVFTASWRRPSVTKASQGKICSSERLARIRRLEGDDRSSPTSSAVIPADKCNTRTFCQ
jgi:hypothetical protein